MGRRYSVLVNGSPIAEFELFKGLRQGDPLSPFLFILAMEGLQAFMCKAEELGLFKGPFIGRDNMNISHLMYADDINVYKSNVIGIGVFDEEVSCMASVIGCGVAKIPLKYLGVPVRCNMTMCSNWIAIIQKFSSKLSLWKARLLLVRGRLSLIKSILGNLPTYHMSIYMKPVVVRKNLESLHNKFFIGSDQDEKKDNMVEMEEVFNEQETWRKIENEGSTQFWNDIWRYSRGGAESSQFDASQAALGNNRCIPFKVNVFLWRLNLNKLPSRVNLDRKRINVGSILCPICHGDVEMVNHTFFNCGMAKDLWALLAKWWELDIPMSANILEWYV
ncbi:putative RNA-directed DNA polymerase, eukaryota, reverse transcriptase zinc-binding domain protein [Tanacetum coccineum]|uniref:RNA-directed DNA polymerase, eukaryota, reverse transcriptase zinc-binding domain protein n=1 Tax=Tanacetum coccineum TaxID=301880 RepID=A0ABQ5BKH6_9ASTR